MKTKPCPGPNCRGADRPYSAFDPDCTQPDLLAKVCKACQPKAVKKCGRCHVEKTLDHFDRSPRTQSPDGLKSCCRACLDKIESGAAPAAPAPGPALATMLRIASNGPAESDREFVREFFARFVENRLKP